MDDEILLETLSGMSFKLNQLILRSTEGEEKLREVVNNIESATYASWKKVLDKDELRIICNAEPKFLLQIEEMNTAIRKNADALLSFNDSFIKQSEKMVSKLNKVLDNQSLLTSNNGYQTANSAKEERKSPSDDKDLTLPSSTSKNILLYVLLLVAGGLSGFFFGTLIF